MQKLGGVPLDFLPFVLIKKSIKQPAICVLKNNELAKNLDAQLKFLGQDSLFLPEFDDHNFPSQKNLSERMEALCILADLDQFQGFLTTTPRCLHHPLPQRLLLLGESVSLTVGSPLNREHLIKILIQKSYRRCEVVYEPGEFAVRGSLLDIFPAGEEFPVRIDVFGDAIETIKTFDPISQRTKHPLTRPFCIRPLNEKEIQSDCFETLSDYIEHPTIIGFDPVKEGDVLISPFVSPDNLDLGGREGRSYHYSSSSLLDLANDLSNYPLSFIACESEGSKERLINIWNDHELPPLINASTMLDKNLGSYVVTAPFLYGFTSKDLCIVSEKSIFGNKFKRQPKRSISLSEFQNFEIDDLVVHQEHGIGRYKGLETLVIDRHSHDCLHIEYTGSDKIFLPVENMDLISRYSDDKGTCVLDRLGTASWQLRKAKIKKRIQIVAQYLLNNAAERSIKEAPIYTSESKAYDEFCKKFPYQETEDQLSSIEEILGDLASGRPMDRLLCGDVGFGKTEVALRAAFLVASQGKQVAVVVPTTLLCRQHGKTFHERFQGTGLRVETLSRLAPNHKKVREEIKNGEISIVIATHTILGENFFDLGLLIVDEEHHFGVKQKEKLKSLAADIHVLTLSATPIPRTLQLSLAGVRELSLISTPPLNRLAVRTFVIPFQDDVIKDAIDREYHRGGQILYVAPRIEFLPKIEKWLAQNFPNLKYGIAHGQISPSLLEDVMERFYDRKYDLLLCTPIVESGIDIPTANTMFIERSDLLGLAQLYQLRGRVGRSQTQGYAYFITDPNHPLTSNAQKRLKIMQSLESLGAGLTLANHDLDIRGAGNLLGEEQSGHIKEVGIELYQKLLHEAVVMVQAKRANEEDSKTHSQYEIFPKIQIGIPVCIPETYISDLGLRLNLYRRVSLLKTEEDLHKFFSEMIDRFGKFPYEVQNLFVVVSLKILCIKAMVSSLDIGPKGSSLTFDPRCSGEVLLDFIKQNYKQIKMRPDNKITIVREDVSLKDHIKDLKVFLKNLATLLAQSLSSEPSC